jgi:hypothetical protein
MKPYLRLAKLFAGFLLIQAAAWTIYLTYVNEKILHMDTPGWIVNIGDRPILISMVLAATGLAILWQHWRTRN